MLAQLNLITETTFPFPYNRSLQVA
uniref:Uncharacterized protein n=1 Tax=Arundo donax TaxID=35708 RepID=A0A0A8Z5B4_ARUDO